MQRSLTTSFVLFIIIYLLNTSLFAQSKFTMAKQQRTWTFGLGVEYLWAEVDGKASYSATGVRGNRFNLDELDLKNSKMGLPVFDFYFGTNSHQLHLEYTQYALDGSKNLSRPLHINGNSYAFNDYLTTDHEVKWGRLYYEFFDSRQNVTYGLLLGVENYMFDYKIKSLATNNTDKFDMTVFNPLVGAHCYLGQDRYGVKLSAFYVPKILDVIDYDTLDLSAALVFSFGNNVQIEGGYRYIDTTLDGSKYDNYEVIKIKGIFASLHIRF